MTEKSVSLFEITDRRTHKNHVVSQVFEDKKDSDVWISRLRTMFPVSEYEEMVKVFKSEDTEITAFRVHIEYKRIENDNRNVAEPND